eukprot:363938-Chlamydomonas_euryale.AAC.7
MDEAKGPMAQHLQHMLGGTFTCLLQQKPAANQQSYIAVGCAAIPQRSISLEQTYEMQRVHRACGGLLNVPHQCCCAMQPVSKEQVTMESAKPKIRIALSALFTI